MINTDNIGNSYYGWRTNNLSYAPESVGFTATQCANWINDFFEQTCAIVVPVSGQQDIRLILPNSFETMTRPVLSSKYRFSIFNVSSNNSNQASIFVGTGLGFGDFGFGSTNRAYYAVLNSMSLSFFACSTNVGNLNNNDYTFISLGWLRNPLYGGGAFPRNAYWLALSSDIAGSRARRIAAENDGLSQAFQVPTTSNADPIANYPINCQTATPGANATEFYLRDNVSPNKAVGYVPNLLKTSLQIPIGQIYLNTGIYPDGSNMNTWICVGNIGSERLLMRAWTQGLG
ncbi:hypothetical protein [Microcystis aeruginosa]